MLNYGKYELFCWPRSHGHRPNIFMVLWQCYQLLSVFLANENLSQVLRQSHLSASNKGDNEVKQGAGHRSPGVGWGNPWKTSARKPSDDRATSHLLVMSVGPHNTSESGKGGISMNCTISFKSWYVIIIMLDIYLLFTISHPLDVWKDHVSLY